MTYNFPYLKDSDFLKFFDETKIKEQFIKLIVLTFDEKPIQEIQGKVTGGSFSLNGSSAMRRTGNINLIADESGINLTNINSLLSINKKVEVLIGFTNTTGVYNDYSIIWFPQGTYVIMAPNINYSSSGLTISLTLHDKMALLNGECGGTLPASVTFSEVQDIGQDGAVVTSNPTIYQIIQQLVNHFGGEPLGKIIISDVDNKIKQVMKWTGGTPLYHCEVSGIHYYDTDYSTISSKASASVIDTFQYGEDIGYILTDFIYPEQLIGNAGDTVVTILDKIKNTLGNYEYFYDIEGNFRFQEIKNYLNNSYSTSVINSNQINIESKDYLVDYTNGKSVYTFENANIITAFSNSPQYQQIKNDFVVWGKRTSIEGHEIPIRYHLAIDNKPIVGNTYKVFFYTDPDDGIVKAKKPLEYETYNNFPSIGQATEYYYDKINNLIYKWNPLIKKYQLTDYELQEVTSADFRTELYLSGVASEPFGLESNYYYTELKNEWPKLYDVENKEFYEQVLSSPSEIDFYLDLIDSSAAISEFSVSNIGRRTVTIVDDSIDCIFEPENPDVVIIDAAAVDYQTQINDCQLRNQSYCLINTNIYAMLAAGGTLKSAYQQIRAELYQYTNYNEQISLTVLPIYYLEPNTRITVRDDQSGIYGDYIIQSITLPLDINGTMNLSCTRALERI